jgi:hypothetical protein
MRSSNRSEKIGSFLGSQPPRVQPVDSGPYAPCLGASETQSEANASISACIRFLYSSDQRAPGLRLPAFCGSEAAGRLISGVGRAPTFSFSVLRDVSALDKESDLFIQA